MEFSSDATDPILDARVRGLITDDVLASYWAASDHFNSGDLVLVYSEDEAEPIEFYRRDFLIAQLDAPESMRKKLSKPASAARSVLSVSDAAFWLVAMFADEQMAIVAVKAKRMEPAGRA